MLAILGPAKTIDMTPHDVTSKQTFPQYLEESEILMNYLRELSLREIKKLMKVSDNLATKTAENIAQWNGKYDAKKGIQALLAFSGEVFSGLKARNLKEKDLLFAQEHVRILSGLYGVLKPLDLILPYRLEMGTSLSNNRGKNLYEFWNNIIPGAITDTLDQTDEKILINLASNEYFKSIDPKNFKYKIITPVFKEQDGDKYRNVTIYAKKARGMMLRFIITNRIREAEKIKAFDNDGYYFNTSLSDEQNWYFTR